MDYHLPIEVWHIIRTAVLVCAKKAPISQLRKALRRAGYWPPTSTAVKELESQCSMTTEDAQPTTETSEEILRK